MITTATAPSIEDLLQTLPDDAHNRKLVSHVHPPDWVNPVPEGRYNMVVIGGGTAGLVTAAGTAGLGGKVALIERDLMGGDCLNVGCVPSKALIRCARAIADARSGEQYGVKITGDIEIDFATVMQRLRRLRADISSNDSAQRFKDLGIDVFIGQGTFTSPQTIEVGGQTLQFAKACIATGARAVMLPIPGLSETGCLTNETLFSLTQLPRRLAVIGAGPIGCEMAQCFARFGSQVTLLEAMRQVLGREDRDAAGCIEKALVKDGVRLNCCCKITGIKRQGAAKIIQMEGDGDCGDLHVDEILLGVGRAPNTDGLGLEAAGVQYDKMGVKVNERLQTSNKRIYAAGDICFAYKFTHTADAMARIVIQNSLFFGHAKTSALTIPWCTYTDPEIAHVGMYEHDAKEKGIPLHTIQIAFDDVDRAIIEGETEGLVKVHLKKGTDRILGATIVARHAGEMISELTLAITAGVGLSTIGKTIHPYPTQAEAIKKAADAYSRTRITPCVQRIFETLLRWRR